MKGKDTSLDVATVQIQLSSARIVLHVAGYSIHEFNWGLIEVGETVSYERRLHQEKDYVIVALGGPGISDLAIYLFDEYNHSKGEDYGTGAVPTVQVMPHWSGNFDIEINLCSLNFGESRYDDYVYGYIIAYK